MSEYCYCGQLGFILLGRISKSTDFLANRECLLDVDMFNKAGWTELKVLCPSVLKNVLSCNPVININQFNWSRAMAFPVRQNIPPVENVPVYLYKNIL